MKKFIFTNVILLMCSLTGMAVSPADHNSTSAADFKFKSNQSDFISVHTNLFSSRDFTPQEKKDQLLGEGITNYYSTDTPATNNTYVLPLNSQMLTDEQIYTLTVNLKYDKEEISEYLFPSAAFPNYKDGLYTNEWCEEIAPESLKFVVPKGSYDIEVKLATINNDFILLTASDINVNGDMDITLDTKDATVEIEWSPLMPDGSIPSSGSQVLDLITGDVLEFIPGNVWENNNVLNFFNNKHSLRSFVSFPTSSYIIDNTTFSEGLGKVKAIPSNDYTLSFHKELMGTEGGYVITLISSTLEPMEIINDIKNYVTIKPEYAYTHYQFDGDILDKDKEFHLGYVIIQNGIMTGIRSFGGSISNTKIKQGIHICQNPETASEYQIMPIPILNEVSSSRNCMMGLPINTLSNPPAALAINNISLLKFSPYLTILR